MDAQSLGLLLPPVVATTLSIATLVFTELRAGRLEQRSAAKDTVEILATQNKALIDEVADLRQRLSLVEQEHIECEKGRTALLLQVVDLQNRLAKEPPAA